MEAILELLPLLFIGAYYLLTSRRKAQKRKQAAQTPLVSGARPEKSPTPFEAFLANLEQSLAQAGGVEPEDQTAPLAAPAPEPILPAAPPPARPIPALGSEFAAPTGSFDALVPVDHDAHGFGAENPYSEERFERAPAFVEPARASEDFDPHGLRRKRRPRPTRTRWRQRLSDPAAARDAFVLQTVFGKRGGRKGDRR
ncbi:hypothetical protein [Rubrivirga sp. IMCC43871]|uniref:hypothetical protein n=1 Tax=Rubrivirga sp. IMCC43871 TaxID=3391575 RepID=UPI00399039EE